jgi:hypothetical protein
MATASVVHQERLSRKRAHTVGGAHGSFAEGRDGTGWKPSHWQIHLHRTPATDPDHYPTTQLRTLQRRIAKWRAAMITTFDDQWLQEEILADTRLPRPLRAVTAPDDTPPATM